jgi:hypothetical protein
MKGFLLTAWIFAFAVPTESPAVDDAPCQVRVVLFVPSDVRPPKEYQQRIDEIARYADSFFETEFERWKIDSFVSPFRRSENGHVEVTVIRGQKATAAYKPVSVRMEVMDDARKRNWITPQRQVWWIMVYTGDPPARFGGYLGGFGEEIGGWSVCNFDTTPGRIDPKALLGSDYLEKLTLKGMIHELGHGFQLPHIGPLQRDDAGNTLMGPTHANFRRVAPASENRVYLSHAEAALLSNHPAFRGEADERKPLPKIEVQNLKHAANLQDKTLVVTGRVRGPVRPNYALVADESDARPGEYWTKTYVAPVAANGDFEVIILEPADSGGTLRTWFAFPGGAQTGDGKGRGRDSGLEKTYTFSRRQWAFKS